jgi:GT2 family glycosyltransferase
MNIDITLIAYALDIAPLVRGLAGPDVTWHVFRHSNLPHVIAGIDSLVDTIPNFHYHPYGTNRGLAVSWNDGILESLNHTVDEHVMLILNDDLLMNRADLLQLASFAYLHPEAGVVVCEGYDAMWRSDMLLQYVAFAINERTVREIGLFDENCVPYCFEDSDLSRRLALADIPIQSAGPTGIVHLGSQSQSVPALREQNQRTFAATAAYYERKWGGLPGREVYPVPFNAAQFGLKITEAQRHAPYPGFNRTDVQELVKI